MKRGHRILFLAMPCAVVAIAIVAALVWPEHEPEYNGRKLSELIGGTGLALSPADGGARVESVRHIGTNALPYLLKWIESCEAYRKTRLDTAVLKVVSAGVARSWLVYRARKFTRALDAVWAFHALGSAAGPAVPELVKLSHSPNSLVAALASDALKGVALPPQSDYIQNATGAPRVGWTNSGSAGTETWAVGHAWRTNSKAQVQATNAESGKAESH